MRRRFVLHLAASLAAVGLPACERNEGCEVTLSCPFDGASERDAAHPARHDSGAVDGEDSPVQTDDDQPSVPSPALPPLPGDGPTSGADASTGTQDPVPIPAIRCEDGSDCDATFPICDVALDRCVVCSPSDDRGCPDDRPHCVTESDATTAQCVECEASAECPLARPICVGQQCVECTIDGHCGLATPVCDDGRCRECSSPTECDSEGERPLCHPSGHCSECLSELDCPAEAPVCDDTGRCTACSAPTDCAHLLETPYCNAESGECVECMAGAPCTDLSASGCYGNACVPCTGPADCAHLLGSQLCDSERGLCVQCLSNADCVVANASTCFADRCTGCTLDEDCSHVPGGPKICGRFRCVECIGTRPDLCVVDGEQYVCDTQAEVCAEPVPENLQGSATACDPCKSDLHCAAGQSCVRTRFEGSIVPGWFCHWDADADGASVDCAVNHRPFTSTLSDVESIEDRDGATVCGLATATCPALEDHGTTQCDPAGNVLQQCGQFGMNDSACSELPAEPGVSVCTLRCATDDDCPSPASCVLSSEPHCSP